MCHVTYSGRLKPASRRVLRMVDLCGKHSHVNEFFVTDNAGVLWSAHSAETSHVDQDGKSLLGGHSQCGHKV